MREKIRSTLKWTSLAVFWVWVAFLHLVLAFAIEIRAYELLYWWFIY